jgi:transcriptional regulator with GAF, ATPase, and Fis domain/tetratricopeptide (TPR) repeat protein
MGTTYLVEDLLTGEHVALKLMAAGQPALLDAFRAEFTTLSGLVHSHLCKVHDFGCLRDPGGELLAFYTAEFIDGETLDLFAAGRPWNEVRKPVTDTLEALRFLHHLGIRHGDVKPSNVLVDRAGRGILIDLGCARPMGAAAQDTIAGTVGYIAPELLEGKVADIRSDLYGVGITLQKVCTMLGSSTPGHVARIVDRLVAADPKDRPTSAAEVIELLGSPCEPLGAMLGTGAPLVGREVEQAIFSRMLDAVGSREPGPRVIYLTGPEGIGRTRMLRELKWQAQLRYPTVEGKTGAAGTVMSMLSHATAKRDLPDGLRGAFEARKVLNAADEPVVLVLDDVHLLPEPQRDLLLGLIRTVEVTDRFLVLCAGQTPPELAGDASIVRELPPLAALEVSRWTGGALSPPMLAEVMRLTGGFPAAVHQLLSQLGAGHVTGDDLERLAGSVQLSGQRIKAVEGMTEECRWTLGLIAASPRGVDARWLTHLSVSTESLGSLLRGGWVQRETGSVRLVRACESPEILAALGAKTCRRLHIALARLLADTGRRPADAEESARLAQLVEHLARGGEIDEAETLFQEGERLANHFPGSWPRAIDALLEERRTPATVLTAAAILSAGGRASRALEVLQAGLDGVSEEASLAAIHRQVGSCLLKQGNAARAIEQLELARSLTHEPGDLAVVADLLSRAHIKRGQYEKALAEVQAGLELATSQEVRADLEHDIGVAASYLGDFDTARRHLATAATLHDEVGLTRSFYRSVSYEAFNEYRAGDAVAAIRGYTRALAIAEEHGMGDEIATSALNLGAVCHQLGDLGRALDSYERGLPMAIALGKVSTEATFRYNLAKLHAMLGQLDRAEMYADGAEKLASSADLRFLLGLVDAVRGEIAVGRSQLDRAKDAFERARSAFSREGAVRESLEATLQMAEVELLEGRIEAAEAIVKHATDGARGLEAKDLSASTMLLEGRLQLARGKAAEAATTLERAQLLAEEVRQTVLLAEIEASLSRAHEAQGATFLARRHFGRARELLERSTTGLPTHVRESFWSHPRWAPIGRLDLHTDASSIRERRLEQLLAINRKLNSSLDLREVLEATMDAAIELTRAERGFVLLVPRELEGDVKEVQIAVARNLDREKIGRSHLKVSRSIAEQVIESGEPVVTVDASSDVRFAENASVHAMKLKSVVCVPVRAPGGILGALYLDNRFRRGRFEQPDLDVLLAFADQAAIALTNARLHDELREHARALEEKSRRIEELARGQAQRIDALVEQVRSTQEALEHRYDYSRIIGRSTAMERVFSVLDRVIDTPATLLIQGESGTGKELVARAVHFNGPRRKGPFVAINCGALPATLLETELFGHVRGAFTGADRNREGLFVSAKGGSLFLDELGEMPASMQVKLLRVLEERKVRPVGATRDIPVDIRLICATNRSLQREVEAGRFRDDLFYRLGVVEVDLPPLRERLEDIPELVEHLLEAHARDLGRVVPALAPEALRALLSYDWPGNVRQLENVLTKALLLAGSDRIEAADLHLPTIPVERSSIVDRSSFEADEGTRILAALRANRWNVSKVVRVLGIPRPSLYRKMKRLGIKRESEG